MEFFWFGVIVHSSVRVPYSKGVFQKYKRDLDEIARCLSQPVYAFQAPSHDPKKRKFIQRLGFKHHHRRLTGDGEWADMYLYPAPLD